MTPTCVGIQTHPRAERQRGQSTGLLFYIRIPISLGDCEACAIEFSLVSCLVSTPWDRGLVECGSKQAVQWFDLLPLPGIFFTPAESICNKHQGMVGMREPLSHPVYTSTLCLIPFQFEKKSGLCVKEVFIRHFFSNIAYIFWTRNVDIFPQLVAVIKLV